MSVGDWLVDYMYTYHSTSPPARMVVDNSAPRMHHAHGFVTGDPIHPHANRYHTNNIKFYDLYNTYFIRYFN